MQDAIEELKHGLAVPLVGYLLLGEREVEEILGQALPAVFIPTLDLDLIVDVKPEFFRERSLSTDSWLIFFSLSSIF